jgi:hypothetical protein
MGFPIDISFMGITPTVANSLIGESVHLACMGVVLYAVFLSDRAPWWGDNTLVSRDNSGGPPKRRRI